MDETYYFDFEYEKCFGADDPGKIILIFKKDGTLSVEDKEN